MLGPGMKDEEKNRHILAEARRSAAIEGEFDQERIDLHVKALTEYLCEPLGRDAMLGMHLEMMQEQRYAQPGMYRTVGVTVGRYQPPTAALVPSLMEELWEYAGTETTAPVVRAA